MNKLGFWKADWFLGLLVAIVMLLAARGDLIQSLELVMGRRGEAAR